jgi:hypothetical protein
MDHLNFTTSSRIWQVPTSAGHTKVPLGDGVESLRLRDSGQAQRGLGDIVGIFEPLGCLFDDRRRWAWAARERGFCQRGAAILLFSDHQAAWSVLLLPALALNYLHLYLVRRSTEIIRLREYAVNQRSTCQAKRLSPFCQHDLRHLL